MQSFPEGGQQMDRFPAVVMGGPGQQKKGLPHTGMCDQCKFPGAEPELQDSTVLPPENVVLFKSYYSTEYTYVLLTQFSFVF